MHPNLRPDPDRVARWRRDIEHLRQQIMTLVMYRDDFAKFEKLVLGNERVLRGSSPFPARVKAWYCDSQVMRIRRILEGKSERGDSYSLRLLLEDMNRACAAFTRGNVEELFDTDDAPKYDQELKEFLVSSMWRNAGDVVKSEDRLYSKQIKEHLKILADAGDRISRFADRYVAHDTKEGLPEDEMPKFPEISACVDAIESVAKHYIATLTGAGYTSLSPVAQHDELDVFRFAWLSDERES